MRERKKEGKGKEGEGKWRGNFAPTVISKRRRMWFSHGRRIDGGTGLTNRCPIHAYTIYHNLKR